MDFEPKEYQSQVLTSIETYFKACHTDNSPSKAFFVVTEALWHKGMSYNCLPGFEADMPYFCLRIPTGGGKTWIAAKSVKLINTYLLHTEYSVILWLVPSNQIKEQTIKGLKSLEHPLHGALKEAGTVSVLSLDEAKSINRSTIDTSTTIIVATRQAFQVENEENRKVYESNGALMQHFDNLSTEQRQELLGDGDTVPYSLANVLRLRRPFIIVDEAHNNRTDLGFDTLAKFKPSGIMELTATPDMEKTPSNVLHSVSASELKAEEMIKLPIRLETEPNWQQCLADAIACRNQLHAEAEKEGRQGANYLRPIVLIQAEAKRSGVETLDVYKVRQELIDNHSIPEESIVIATGEERGLTQIEADYKLGITDPKCPARFVITQKALAEGWDCPFAYILVSMASLHSTTAVEQLLGRILRQPDATQRHSSALNQSYAFVVSRYFSETASILRDKLVAGSGFERKNVADFVQAGSEKQNQEDLEIFFRGGEIKPVVVPLEKKPNLVKTSKPLKKKIVWDKKASTLTITQPLTIKETEALKETVTDPNIQAILEKAAEKSRIPSPEFFQTPSERGEIIKIPQLAVYIQSEFQLFDDPEMLDYPWDLSLHDAIPTKEDISELNFAFKVAESGNIDISEQGKIVTQFMFDLERTLGLTYQPENKDIVKLATWLCKNLPDDSITHDSKQAFIANWLQCLLKEDKFDLARANQQQFVIRLLLEKRINSLRKETVVLAYQQTLFNDDINEKVLVNDNYTFTFSPHIYSPNSYYDVNNAKYGQYSFKHHYYGQIGDFDSKEEMECACYLDLLAEKKQIKFWIRNLVRKEGCSFFLQKANGRFYPDFICVLPDDTILIVEYKGADRWKSAEDDRLIGGLWASLSNGKCKFIMVKEKQWNLIDDSVKI